MPEFQLIPRPTLAPNARLNTAGISLKPLPYARILHLLCKHGAPRPALPAQFTAADHSIRPAAPGQWFVIIDASHPEPEVHQMIDGLGPEIAVVDQSHGRVGIAISGPQVERVLAKGTGVDLTLAAFPVGHSATTLVGHIAAHLTRVGDQSFELLVLRSFANSLWDDLVRMSADAV